MTPTPVIASEARQSIPTCHAGPGYCHAGPDPASMPLVNWLPIILGLAVLYLPSLYDLFTGIWSSDEPMPRHIVFDISAVLLIIGLDTAVQKFGPFRQNQA